MRIFVPLNISAHPYLKLLYGNLGDKLGVKIYDLNRKINIFKILKSDVIHIHWIEHYIRSTKGIFWSLLRFIFFLSLFIFLKILKRKIFITMHNLEPHEKIYPKLESFGFKIYINKIADVLIVHNTWSKKEIIKIYGINPQKIKVIPHGNFIGYYPNEITNDFARKKLGIPLNAFVILYFGKIRKYKGLSKLFLALRKLKRYDKNLWVLICGKLEDERFVNELLKFKQNFKNCILKLDYIPDDDVQVYMNASDVGILPYEKITTSGTLLLFASFKKPVIVPNLEPIRETANNAVIYYDGSTEDLRIVIEDVLNTPKEIKKKSKKIFKIALRYNWGTIATKTFEAYRESFRERVIKNDNIR